MRIPFQKSATGGPYMPALPVSVQRFMTDNYVRIIIQELLSLVLREVGSLTVCAYVSKEGSAQS